MQMDILKQAICIVTYDQQLVLPHVTIIVLCRVRQAACAADCDKQPVLPHVAGAIPVAVACSAGSCGCLVGHWASRHCAKRRGNLVRRPSRQLWTPTCHWSPYSGVTRLAPGVVAARTVQTTIPHPLPCAEVWLSSNLTHPSPCSTAWCPAQQLLALSPHVQGHVLAAECQPLQVVLSVRVALCCLDMPGQTVTSTWISAAAKQ